MGIYTLMIFLKKIFLIRNVNSIYEEVYLLFNFNCLCNICNDYNVNSINVVFRPRFNWS